MSLTADDIRALPAGPELDKLVALAIGGEFDPTEGTWEFGNSAAYLHEWHPSSSWNEAMFAAEKFGLFGWRHKPPHYNPASFALYKQLVGLEPSAWIIGYSQEEPDFARGSTGPEAISRAIALLALEGK